MREARSARPQRRGLASHTVRTRGASPSELRPQNSARYHAAMRSNAPPPTAADAEPVRLEFAPDVVSLYWYENVGIMAWHQAPSAAVIEALHAGAADRRARYPSGMSFIHFGRVQISLLDSETRQAFVRILRELQHYVAATALITRANGFWASTLRGVATGIVVLSRSAAEIRFHERPEELLDWLPARHERVTGVKLDPEQFLRVLQRAAAELEPP